MKTFEEYDKENPNIWILFKRTALNAIEKGFKNYSSKGIFEVIRWHRGGNIKEDGFKLNNNYTCDYARKFILEFPEHKDFFRIRTSK